MRISSSRCVGCGNCVAVCPVSAIRIEDDGRASVDSDACVECYTCYRGLSTERLNPTLIRAIRRVLGWFRLRFDPEPDICPTSAIEPDELAWPRIVRRAFSDPLVSHEATGVHGRGTEEVKTNDVTGRVAVGECGMTVEFGRPGVSASFRDIDRVTRRLASIGVAFEKKNPVTNLMSDTSTGAIREDLLGERVLSAIVEIKIGMERVPEILRVVEEEAAESETILSLGAATRCGEDGSDDLGELLAEHGYDAFRGKTNLGLGRPAADGGG